MMSIVASVDEVVRMWNEVIESWRNGEDRLPLRVQRWRSCYRGRGAGEVDLSAIPEPYLGEWRKASAVVLALNPGQVYPKFQHRGGIFDREIGERGSYEAWAASWAFVRAPWTDDIPAVVHTTSRLAFLRRWFGEPDLPQSGMLAVELYPWHSARVNAALQPDPGIIRDYVWEPISDSGIRHVFAFGAPWFNVLEHGLGMPVLDRLGAGGRAYGSRVLSRAVRVFEAPGGITVIAEKHNGSAGPPAADETLLLRKALGSG
jgi:hypothetical protein